MSKHLRSITEGKLEGVKSSKTVDAEVYGGADASINKTDPGTVKFVKKHKVEKHDDRAGNGPGVFTGKKEPALDDAKEVRHRPEKGVYEEAEEDPASLEETNTRFINKAKHKDNYADTKALMDFYAKGGEVKKIPSAKRSKSGYTVGKSSILKKEEVEIEEAICNSSPAGKHCPAHGDKDCSKKPKMECVEVENSAKKLSQIVEMKASTLGSYTLKASAQQTDAIKAANRALSPHTGTVKSFSKAMKIADKRGKGVALAIKKITHDAKVSATESVLDEKKKEKGVKGKNNDMHDSYPEPSVGKDHQ